MWQSRTVFIIPCNVSSLWACALTATHTLHTPTSLFQSLRGWCRSAEMPSIRSLLKGIFFINYSIILPSIPLPTRPSSSSLFCCSGRASWSCLGSQALLFLALILLCPQLSLHLSELSSQSHCTESKELSEILGPTFSLFLCSEVFLFQQHVLGTWVKPWLLLEKKQKVSCSFPEIAVWKLHGSPLNTAQLQL